MEQGRKQNVILDTLTGEQFKTLVEQLSPDGKINTIPELIDFLNGIPEGMTLQEYIAEHSTPSPGSVGMDELNDEVRNTMVTGEDRVTQEDLDNFEV